MSEKLPEILPFAEPAFVKGLGGGVGSCPKQSSRYNGSLGSVDMYWLCADGFACRARHGFEFGLAFKLRKYSRYGAASSGPEAGIG